MDNVGITASFWVLAVVGVASALAVVFLRDIFRAALFLVLCFFTVAGVFVILSADFLAVAQVLIYVGAIAVLIIFALMLTRGTQRGSPSGRFRFTAFLVGAVFLVTMILVVTGTDWQAITEAPTGSTTSALAHALFSEEEGFILPFEIAAALLLAAVIGAIVLIREK
jgi:NADH:ubiquinone oxidoreductase subunit 6 (subunit J)